MRRARLALMAALLGLTGCQTVSDSMSGLYSSWFGSKEHANKVSPLPEIKGSPVRTVWQASVGSSGEAVFVPTLVASGAFAAARDGTVARFDLETGKPVWRVVLKRKLSGGVGADRDLTVVATEEGEVIALSSEDGSEKWAARVSSAVLSAPSIANGIVVVRSGDNNVFGFDAADGKRKWVYQRVNPPLALRSHAGVTAAAGAVFAGFPGGKLAAINISNGAVGWEGTVALPRGTTELERIADVVGEPSLDREAVCAAAFQGRVACFNPSTGQPRWSKDISSSTGLAMDPRQVYLTDDHGAVLALDRNNGASLWKQDKLSGRRVTAPAASDPVAVGDYQGHVHFLSSEDGAFVARAATDGSPITASPVPVKDGVVVLTRNGNLYRLAVR